MPYDEFLEKIKFKSKLLRAIAFARLHGSSLMVFYNGDGDLRKGTPPYFDCEVFHKYCRGNGWTVNEIDDFGNPKSFTITIQTEEMQKPLEFIVSADRCVVFMNPRKGQRWDGTPSSIAIAHYIQAEELTVKNAVKWVMLHAKATALFTGVTNQTQADRIHDIFNHGQADELMTNNIQLEWKAPPLQSLGQSLGTFFNILANLQARTLRVSRQAMDGAPEGTLSSAQYNYILTYAGVEQVQEHFKPYIEQCFRMFGFKNPNIDFPKLQLTNVTLEDISKNEPKENLNARRTVNVNSARDEGRPAKGDVPSEE